MKEFLLQNNHYIYCAEVAFWIETKRLNCSFRAFADFADPMGHDKVTSSMHAHWLAVKPLKPCEESL